MKAGQGFNVETPDPRKDIFPRDENGIPLNTFLVTVKNKDASTKESEVTRFLVFASTSSEAHQKVTDYMTRDPDLRESWLRISVEFAQIVSGGGIVLL